MMIDYNALNLIIAVLRLGHHFEILDVVKQQFEPIAEECVVVD